MSDERQSSRSVASTAVGFVIGTVTGLAIWLTTDLFVFFPVFIGIGVVLGLVFKEANQRQDRS